MKGFKKLVKAQQITDIKTQSPGKWDIPEYN